MAYADTQPAVNIPHMGDYTSMKRATMHFLCSGLAPMKTAPRGKMTVLLLYCYGLSDIYNGEDESDLQETFP